MADDVSDFSSSMGIATSGLRVQAGRMRVISENIANAESTAPKDGPWSASEPLPAPVSSMRARLA